MTGVVDESLNGRKAFGILRALRRGVTSHAKEMELPGEWIDMMNRWRTEANSKTGTPQLDMSDVYASLESLKPLLLPITQWF